MVEQWVAVIFKDNWRIVNLWLVYLRKMHQKKTAWLFDEAAILGQFSDRNMIFMLLEQLKSEFIRTVKSNKYRSQMTVQSNNNNLNYLIDPTFTKVNRLFVLPFERIKENNKKDHRDSFSHYFVPNVEIKDFNVLIDEKGFFDLPVKNEEETYDKIIEMSRNNDYTTGNLLDFAYFKKKITG